MMSCSVLSALNLSTAAVFPLRADYWLCAADSRDVLCVYTGNRGLAARLRLSKKTT